MKKTQHSVSFQSSLAKITLLLVFFYPILQSCQMDLPEAEISLDEFQLADGFRIECVAAEPIVDTPVAMAFDDQHRLWIAEMPGYMPNVDGLGEDAPTGAIVRLEDRDGDGQMDTRHVFLDSLVLVRALAFANGGLIYAEPPNLWWVGIENDMPGEHILVDSAYAPGSNPEYQANGLLYNLDNWIYNADSDKRYQCRNGQWFTEPTLHRGQWGITHDRWGKLFYNNNSTLLLGDYFLPNFLERNPMSQPKKSVRQVICPDQRVYPSHATLVNRGYQPGVVDSEGRVVETTSACGPHIFLGENFPAKTHYGHAFVCVPEANLVKQIHLSDPLISQGDETEVFVSGKFTYPDGEFLTSTDGAFRPVNLNTGSDGALYLADMRRGIIQHQAYMSRYLRGEILKRGLDSLTGLGRIYRIVHQENELGEPADFSEMKNEELVKWLGHENGHLRLKAQRLLIERQAVEVVDVLRKMVTHPNDVETVFKKTDSYPYEMPLHALWTLDGLNELDDNTLIASIFTWQKNLSSAGLKLLRTHPAEDESAMQDAIFSAMHQEDKVLKMNLLAIVGELACFDIERRYSILKNLLGDFPNDAIACEAALSGLSGQESSFLKYLNGQEAHPLPEDHLIFPMLKKAIAWQDIPPLPPNQLFDHNDPRTAGLQLYREYCAACHRLDGVGTPGLAPSLVGSEVVNGKWTLLGNTIWYGQDGPVTVNGEVYREPMPAFEENPAWDGRMLEAVVAYVKNAFAEPQ